MTLQPPKDLPLTQILPPEPLLLMGAGPVPIPHQVSQANGVVINHLGETMDKVVERVKLMAAYAFQTSTTSSKCAILVLRQIQIQGHSL